MDGDPHQDRSRCYSAGQEGKLTRDEAERLKTLASHDTSTLAINALMVCGAAAVSAGILALNPSFAAGAALGIALVLVGLAVTFRGSEQCSLLGTATTIIGALLLSGGVIGLFEGAFAGTRFTGALLFGLAVLVRSSFLMALVPSPVAPALGSTGYIHATFMLIVSEPAITIIVFSLLAAAAYFLSQQLDPAYEKLALVFARVSLLLVNFGFWVGSLWGDYPGEGWRAASLHIPDYVFVIGWAILLVAVGIWGAYENRRWVVNTAATFGAIHFYTQWFERLGAQPWAIIVAGLTVVAVAVALWRYNAGRSGAAASEMAA
jgi:iron complex transport system permease protein